MTSGHQFSRTFLKSPYSAIAQWPSAADQEGVLGLEVMASLEEEVEIQEDEEVGEEDEARENLCSIAPGSPRRRAGKWKWNANW